MTEFEITAALEKIDFAPSTEAMEIIQNVRTILGTPMGSVPLDRTFGLPWGEIDGPQSIVQAKLTAAIVEAIEKGEPRVRVTEVIFQGDGMDGILRPKVRVRRV